MKNKVEIAIMIVFLLAGMIEGQSQISLEITVDNITNIEGSLRVGISKNAKDFPDKSGEGKVILVSGNSMTVVFEGVQPGDYAISVFHDENNNETLDTNLFGLPKEGFAFGNNAMGMFGPPSFDNAKITVKNKTVKHTITLKYF
ncbi:MAG: DUF2141 domain-containing protein [Cyclobacteriaceae bacterium]